MPKLIYFFLLAELFFVSYGDVKTQRIPNLWSLLNILIYIIFCFAFPDIYVFDLNTFLVPIIILASGFLFFLLKVMGGGDSKFMFSFFLTVPQGYHEGFFWFLLYSTTIIGLFMFFTNTAAHFKSIINCIKLKQYKEMRKFFGSKFAFAPVILIAWLWLGLAKGMLPF